MDEKIVEQFEEFGFDPPKDEVLEKCVELCCEYNVTDADFVDRWIAYSISNLNGANPTVSLLEEFERKDLIPEKEKNNDKMLKKSAIGLNNCYSNLAEASEDYDLGDEVIDVVGTYCKTPKTPKMLTANTPPMKRIGALFTPISYSPVNVSQTPRSHKKLDERILYTFGNSNLVKQVSWSSTASTSRPENITVKQILTYEDKPMSTKSRFMYDRLIDKSDIMYERLWETGMKFCKKAFGENNFELHNADRKSNEIFQTVGRICCDPDECKLTQTSTMLIGLSQDDEEDEEKQIMEEKMEFHSVFLNFWKTKSVGIFPGQTVVLSGINLNGNTIHVEEIHSERILERPTLSKLESDLRLVIAAGPFTDPDDLAYESLYSLFSYCKENKPDVLILVGPFISADHNSVVKNQLAESFDSVFEKMVTGIVEAIGNEITICMVSSQKDAISPCVYPTHPLSTKKTFPNVHMLPDPCIIDVNGLTIGATSTDILTHLLNEELALNSGDKIKRVVKYLFHQGSFYPLDPHCLEVSLDTTLVNKYARLDVIPNALILPSEQKYFIREVEGCMIINPGQLVSSTNGTFAKITFCPNKGVLDSECVFGQIIKM